MDFGIVCLMIQLYHIFMDTNNRKLRAYQVGNDDRTMRNTNIGIKSSAVNGSISKNK